MSDRGRRDVFADTFNIERGKTHETRESHNQAL